MPGFYEDDAFVNNRPTRMNARLREVIDDIEGQYGVQKAYHFYDVEILETRTGDPYIAKDDEFTAYCKQSSKPNSKDAAVVRAWNAFARDHFGVSGGNRFSNFNDKLLTFEEVEVTEGGTDRQDNEISPGVFLCPIAEVEASKPRGKKSSPAPKVEDDGEVELGQAEESAVEVDPRLVEKALELIEKGTTKAMLTRELNSKGGSKKALEAAGGLNALLSFLGDRIAVDGQAVSIATEEPVESNEEDDLPF